jgi:hypothetical protein
MTSWWLTPRQQTAADPTLARGGRAGNGAYWHMPPGVRVFSRLPAGGVRRSLASMRAPLPISRCAFKSFP